MEHDKYIINKLFCDSQLSKRNKKVRKITLSIFSSLENVYYTQQLLVIILLGGLLHQT